MKTRITLIVFLAIVFFSCEKKENINSEAYSKINIEKAQYLDFEKSISVPTQNMYNIIEDDIDRIKQLKPNASLDNVFDGFSREEYIFISDLENNDNYNNYGYGLLNNILKGKEGDVIVAFPLYNPKTKSFFFNYMIRGERNYIPLTKFLSKGSSSEDYYENLEHYSNYLKQVNDKKYILYAYLIKFFEGDAESDENEDALLPFYIYQLQLLNVSDGKLVDETFLLADGNDKKLIFGDVTEDKIYDITNENVKMIFSNILNANETK